MKLSIFLLTVGFSLQAAAQSIYFEQQMQNAESKPMRIAMAHLLSTLSPAPFETRAPAEQEKYLIVLAGLNAAAGKSENAFVTCSEIRESYLQLDLLGYKTELLVRHLNKIQKDASVALATLASVTQLSEQKIMQWAQCVVQETQRAEDYADHLENQRTDQEIQARLSEMSRLQ